MRPSEVTRASIVLALAAALACVWFAWATTSSAAPASASAREPVALTIGAGRETFERRCARCHTLDEAAAPLRAARCSPTAVLEQCAFLVEHAHLDESRARAVVLYLCGDEPR